ncbi:MAG TPA: lipoyl(octanoyl) transferase LipB [Bacteroidia bacterium]|nr:lipoyl(octanoyl) transferase LipB [Bacteroidia bacterium]
MVPVKKIDLGVVDYQQAWDYQEQLFAENVNLKVEARKLELGNEILNPKSEIRNFTPETLNLKPGTTNYLLFCEHPHVYTLGKSGKPEHLLVDSEGLANINATYHKINRGGDITYHGFGQMVVYPIWDLETYFYTDIHRFLRDLEEAVILTLADYNIIAGRVEGLTGVWIEGDKPDKARKICAMGIRCSRWITMHGIALNVNTDLNYFNYIVPCGIDDKSVTSMEKELGQPVNLTEVKQKFRFYLSKVFGIEFIDN